MMCAHAIERAPAIGFGMPVKRLPWTVEDRRSLLRKMPWLEVFQESVRLPDGRLIEDFYQVEMPDWVVIVACTVEGRLVLERHYRHGARRYSWTLPAGFVDAGESPELAARRELLEETGYEAARWRPLGAFTVDGNRGCGRSHFFFADGCRLAAQPLDNDHSPIEVTLMEPAEALRRLHVGEVAELATATGLGLAAIELAKAETRPASTAI
jgi:ADP-ribose pyrophosphatase